MTITITVNGEDRKVSHVRRRGNGYFFEATAKMREAGMASEPLGMDPIAAVTRADTLNALWKSIRKGEALPPSPAQTPGTIDWLIAEYKKDPYWYLDLAQSTRDRDLDPTLNVIAADIGPYQAKAIDRAICRAMYNKRVKSHSAAGGARLIKWLRRLFGYAIERGVVAENPASGIKVVDPKGRTERLTPGQVEALVVAAREGGRPEIALATLVAWDSILRQGDILSLTKAQWDGVGFELIMSKSKVRGGEGRKVYAPVSPSTAALVSAALATGFSLIVNPETGKAYNSVTFQRRWRAVARKAGIPDSLEFRDLRRTGYSEMAESGADAAGVKMIAGHTPDSKMAKVYLSPDKESAITTAEKRWTAREKAKQK